MAKTKLPPDLLKTAKKVKGRVKVLAALPYQGINVYVRQVDLTMFEYLFAWRGEVWSNYIVMQPEKGKDDFTRKQINSITQILFAGAHTTIESLMGLENKETEAQKALGELVIDSAKPLKEDLPN